jgi:dihydroflavonol-4-reductase
VKILVTGATGFLGSVLVPRLIRRFGADSVAAYVLPGDRPPVTWREEPVEIVFGDIADEDRMARACRGRSHVIHLAGLISYWRRDYGRLMKVNRGGVRAVVRACLSARVERLVHVSSVGAVGFKKRGELIDEGTPFNWPPVFHYMWSKYLGQRVVENAAGARGLPAVILNPASIMGPGDHDPRTPHNSVYEGVYRGNLFGSLAGGLGVVDVRDVAAIAEKALTGGRTGERYLLVGANLTYAEVLRLIARHSGRPVYPFRVPGVLLTGAGVALETASLLTRRRPLLTRSYGALSGWTTFYDNSKSRRDFNHSYVPIDLTIRDSCRYFERNHLRLPPGGSDGPGD